MKKKIYIQILGVIACLAVVAMHVNGCFWQFSYDRYWITANIIECICYFAVPIFFMISGATLLNYRKRYTTAVFFKKRFGKTLVPFLIWSVISAIWYYIVYHARPEGIREVVDGILNTRYVDIYWFSQLCFPYICVSRSCPVFRRSTESGSLAMRSWCILFWKHWHRLYVT